MIEGGSLSTMTQSFWGESLNTLQKFLKQSEHNNPSNGFWLTPLGVTYNKTLDQKKWSKISKEIGTTKKKGKDGRIRRQEAATPKPNSIAMVSFFSAVSAPFREATPESTKPEIFQNYSYYISHDGSMGRTVYLPTWMVDVYGKCR